MATSNTFNNNNTAGTFRVSRADQDTFSNERVGDLVLAASSNTQRILIGNNTDVTSNAMVTVTSNTATIAGTVNAEDVSAYTMQTTDIFLTLYDPTRSNTLRVIEPVYQADLYTQGLAIYASNAASYACNIADPAAAVAACNLALYASNAASYASTSVGDTAPFASNLAVAINQWATLADGTLSLNYPVDLTGTTQISGSIVPTSDATVDLGTSDRRFRSLYVSGSTIYLGSNVLSSDDTGTLSIRRHVDDTPARIIVEEVQVGNAAAGSSNVTILRANSNTGAISFVTASIDTNGTVVEHDAASNAVTLDADFVARILFASNVAADTSNAVDALGSNIQGSNATFTGTVAASALSATSLSAATLSATSLSATSLSATSLSATTLTASNLITVPTSTSSNVPASGAIVKAAYDVATTAVNAKYSDFTFSSNLTVQGGGNTSATSLSVTGSASLTGAVSSATLSTSGLATLNSASVTNGLSSATLSTSGLATLSSAVISTLTASNLITTPTSTSSNVPASGAIVKAAYDLATTATNSRFSNIMFSSNVYVTGGGDSNATSLNVTGSATLTGGMTSATLSTSGLATLSSAVISTLTASNLITTPTSTSSNVPASGAAVKAAYDLATTATNSRFSNIMFSSNVYVTGGGDSNATSLSVNGSASVTGGVTSATVTTTGLATLSSAVISTLTASNLITTPTSTSSNVPASGAIAKAAYDLATTANNSRFSNIMFSSNVYVTGGGDSNATSLSVNGSASVTGGVTSATVTTTGLATLSSAVISTLTASNLITTPTSTSSNLAASGAAVKAAYDLATTANNAPFSNIMFSSNVYVTGGGNSNATSLSVTGAILATGDITAFSDARFKTDVEPLAHPLQSVRALTGCTFHRYGVDGQPDSRRYLGLLAQDVERVQPEAVYCAEDGKLSVAYGNLVALLVEAVKELSDRVDAGFTAHHEATDMALQM